MSGRPFKKFHCDQDDVFLIPPIAFKIWMYHYTREGKERKSWPSREVICKKLNISIDTLKKWRKWLVANKWLVPVGQRNARTGEFSVPVFMVDEGTVEGEINHGNRGRKHPPPSRVKNTAAVAGEVFTPEVDSGFEVDTKREVEEKTAMSQFAESIKELCEQANVRPDWNREVWRELERINKAHPNDDIEGRFEQFLADNIGSSLTNPVASFIGTVRKNLPVTLGKVDKTDTNLFKDYLLWAAKTFYGLNLTSKEKFALEAYISNCPYPIEVLKQATRKIMNGLNPENQFDKCGDKLASNLEVQCEVVTQENARLKQQEVDIARTAATLRAEAEEEFRKAEEARQAEESLIEDELR